MFEEFPPKIRLLDAGAGVGSLTAVFVETLYQWHSPPPALSVLAWEIDTALGDPLNGTLQLCQTECARLGIDFEALVHQGDFIKDAVEMIDGGLFSFTRETIDFAILNPPYRKTRSSSAERYLMRRVGIETSNLYTAFMALAVKLLEPGGSWLPSRRAPSLMVPISSHSVPSFWPRWTFGEFTASRSAICYLRMPMSCRRM
ncbi:MAG: hypothetical protein EXS58_09275 [Candidatus Latescibacteria bacterium]|nr:hypothetical protein [Candidatus Latescibacterota bacterium]